MICVLFCYICYGSVFFFLNKVADESKGGLTLIVIFFLTVSQLRLMLNSHSSLRSAKPP